MGRRDDLAQIERLIPLLRAPRRTPGETIWRGRKVRYADGASFHGQLNEIYGQKCYDFETENPRPRILDLGGNVGVATLRFRERHPQADIIVFEPDPSLLTLLRDNLANAGDSTTRVIPAAVWDYEGLIGFNSTGDDSGNVSASADEKIHCVDLADYCRSRVDFLKMDIEGAEAHVLRHLSRLNLLSNIDRLFIELHHWKDTEDSPFFHEILGILAQGGFDYRVTSAEVFSAAGASDPFPGSGNLLTLRAWKT